MAQITPANMESATVFTVTYKDGGEEVVVNAAIKANDRYLDTFDRTSLPARLELILDEPWNGSPSIMVLIQNIVEAEPEPSAKRKLRYDNSGFEEVTVEGATLWVPVETTNRYERMLALQADQEAEREALYSSVAGELAEQGSADGGAGFVALWGRHVVVLVAAVVAIVLCVKLIL